MTEAEWLTATDPAPLFRLVEKVASERKCILFSVACHHLPPAYDPSFPQRIKQQAAKFEAAVAFADGTIDVPKVRQLWLDRGEEKSLPERGHAWAKGWANPPFRDMEDPFEEDVASLVRDVFGNPFRSVVAEQTWFTSTTVGIAEAIYADRAFDRLPILADALQDAGCENEYFLAHCRDVVRRHVRGCWVVDLVLGKS